MESDGDSKAVTNTELDSTGQTASMSGGSPAEGLAMSLANTVINVPGTEVLPAAGEVEVKTENKVRKRHRATPQWYLDRAKVLSDTDDEEQPGRKRIKVGVVTAVPSVDHTYAVASKKTECSPKESTDSSGDTTIEDSGDELGAGCKLDADDSDHASSGNVTRQSKFESLRQFCNGEIDEMTIDGEKVTRKELMQGVVSKEDGFRPEDVDDCVIVSCTPAPTKSKPAPSGPGPSNVPQEAMGSGGAWRPEPLEIDSEFDEELEDMESWMRSQGQPYRSSGVSKRSDSEISIHVSSLVMHLLSRTIIEITNHRVLYCRLDPGSQTTVRRVV